MLHRIGGALIVAAATGALVSTAGTAGAGSGGATGTPSAPDGALVLPDAAWLVLPGGDALALPAA